ncbi:MerR family transcriptional regulator [Christensenellaceae bacterium OttesenSCG-928-M15]|nr:MerR family transcriptional regulator [Christensenellaceae bacterium OttesenSCG-928-M15]
MKYKIGEFASLLDVSLETIRFYEKQGLINPERDERNGYRLYDPVDLNLLIRLRSYIAFGFSVTEAINMINHDDLGDFSDKMEHKIKHIKEKIRYEQQLVAFMQHKRMYLRRVSGMLGQCVVENSPALYGMIYRTNQNIDDDPSVRERMRSWLRMRPFTETMVRYPLPTWQGGRPEALHGLLIFEQFKDMFSVEETEGVFYFPSQRCVYTITAIPYEENMRNTDRKRFFYDYAQEYMSRNGLTPAGTSIGRWLHTSGKSGETVHYCEQWIPIKE